MTNYYRIAGNACSDVGRRYNQLMVKNKSGVVNSLRNLMAKAQEVNQSTKPCKLLGTVVSVIKHNSHKEKNPLQARYNICTYFIQRCDSSTELMISPG